MYFFYIDESGSKDPAVEGIRPDGARYQKDWLYVTVALSLFEQKWVGFEKTLNARKSGLLDRINRATGLRLDLADAELKSAWVRIPKERDKRPFLANLSDQELRELVELFYSQIQYHKMHLFAVVVDKRKLRDYMTQERLHRKAYELLLERIESFLWNWHDKHRGLIVVDNTSKEMNRSLAMKHSFFLREGTTSGLRLRHIVELPMFVESYLSNGVQLADLCAYNIYRAFKDGDLSYPHFSRLIPAFYTSPHTPAERIDGLKVFPDDSELIALVRGLEETRRLATVGGEPEQLKLQEN